MTFLDIEKFMRDVKRRESEDRWTLAFTGVCPYCENRRGQREVDRDTGEIEWIWCHFCHSEAELEAKNQA